MDTSRNRTDGGAVTLGRARGSARGFTLLELMIVITIIVILATIAAGRYEQAIVRAHEAALKQDLFVMRQAIQQYTEDKEAPPSSLDDLKSAGYIGDVPTDPMTHEKDWTTDPCDEMFSADQTSTQGICDVHSSSSQVSPFDNVPYSSY